MTFSGSTYDAPRDHDRLTHLQDKVRRCMASGGWWTISALQHECGGTEASVSARIRDLRKPANGGYVVEREYVRRGLFRYRMQPQAAPVQARLL